MYDQMFKKCFADRVKLCASNTLDRRLLNSTQTEVNAAIDIATDSLIMQLTTYIHGLPGERIFFDESYPKAWWDAFKQRWFPAWALKRWPAEMKRIYVDKQQYLAVCPHIDDPHQGTHLEWLSEKQ